MFTSIKRSFYVLSNKLRSRRQPVERMKEKWVADFSKPEKSCFDIKPEISYNAYLDKSPPYKKGEASGDGALFLGLKRKNCMAWIETARRVYVNQVIEACFRFNSFGGYCAAGIMFRIVEHGTYYLVIISSKGFFRIDAVNNNVPKTLIGWTEAPGITESALSSENLINLGIIARDDHIIFTLNGSWIAELYDDSIPGGHLGFALVSYDLDDTDQLEKNTEERYLPPGKEYVCKAWLDYLSVDSRTRAVETEYLKWIDSMEISAKSRFRLVESLVALSNFGAAYDQILKIWKQRDEAVRGVMATYTEIRARSELLFATRIALMLEQYTDALEYINACLALDGDGDEDPEKLPTDALAEKVKILDALNKHDELAALLPGFIKQIHAGTDSTELPSLYALFGRACLNTGDYNAAATAWVKAFSFDKSNGNYAAGAADAFDMLGKKNKALQWYIDGAKCFLQKERYIELGVLVPKMLAVGKASREVYTLAEKWASGIGDNVLAKSYRAMAKKPAASESKVKPEQTKPAKAQKAPLKPTENVTVTKAKLAKAQKAPPKPAESVTVTKAKPAKVQKASIKPAESATVTKAKPAKVAKAPVKAQKAPVKPTESATVTKAKPAKAAKAPVKPTESAVVTKAKPAKTAEKKPGKKPVETKKKAAKAPVKPAEKKPAAKAKSAKVQKAPVKAQKRKS